MGSRRTRMKHCGFGFLAMHSSRFIPGYWIGVFC